MWQYGHEIGVLNEHYIAMTDDWWWYNATNDKLLNHFVKNGKGVKSNNWIKSINVKLSNVIFVLLTVGPILINPDWILQTRIKNEYSTKVIAI